MWGTFCDSIPEEERVRGRRKREREKERRGERERGKKKNRPRKYHGLACPIKNNLKTKVYPLSFILRIISQRF